VKGGKVVSAKERVDGLRMFANLKSKVERKSVLEGVEWKSE